MNPEGVEGVDVSAMACPQCGGSLSAGRFGEAEVRMCEGCLGTLVAQRFLIRLLSHGAKAMEGEIDFDCAIDPLPDSGERLCCPTCDAGMERFGYLGTNLVRASRCGDCGLIWGSCEEIGVMSVLWARTNLRSESNERERDAVLEGLNRRVTAIIRARMRSGRIGNALLG